MNWHCWSISCKFAMYFFTYQYNQWQVSTLLNVHVWHARNNDALEVNEQVLDVTLFQLETNQHQLKDSLSALTRKENLRDPTKLDLTDIQGTSVIAIIVSLQWCLHGCSDDNQECQFFSHVLRYLTMSTGLQVELQDWMILPYEVEFRQKIGTGGLYFPLSSLSAFYNVLWPHLHNSGQVFLGIWNNTPVVLKVLMMASGITPSSMVCDSFCFADKLLIPCL